MNHCYTEGWKAYYERTSLKDNPYHHLACSLEDEGSWNTGWRDAKGAEESRRITARSGRGESE